MKKLFAKSFLLSAIGAAALIGAQAQAATATATFTVTATVSPSCTVAANNIAFGAFSPAATGEVTTTSTLTVTCTNTTGYTLTLSPGASGNAAARTMAGRGQNTDVLSYAIYKDSGRSAIFGNTPADGVVGTGNGVAQTVTLYSSVPKKQYIKQDLYTDNLTVTLEY